MGTSIVTYLRYHFDANGVLAIAACTAANTFTRLFSIHESMSTITQTDSKNNTDIRLPSTPFLLHTKIGGIAKI